MSAASPTSTKSAASNRHIPAWAPLRVPLFRALWIASLAFNIGTWMHEVGASWLMTSLSKDAHLMRLRDGALRWNLFQDAADPTRWVETMLVESWNEHLRQHARVSHDSEQLELAARGFHRGEDEPRVSHLIAATARRFEEAEE